MTRPSTLIAYKEYAAFDTYLAFDFFGNNKVIYAANTHGTFDLWVAELGPGQIRNRARLTNLPKWSIRFVDVRSEDSGAVFFADEEGKENYQIFKLKSIPGHPEPLVFEPGIKHQFGAECLSPNANYIAYSSNARTRDEFDLVKTDTRTKRSKVVLGEGGHYVFGYWSPDSSIATVLDSIGIANSDIYVVNMNSGERWNVVKHEHNEKVINLPGPWYSNHKFFVLSNLGREFVGLGLVDIRKEGKINWIARPHSDIMDVVMSPNREVLAWVENKSGYSVIRAIDYKSRNLIFRPIDTKGVMLPGWQENKKLMKFSRNGKLLLFLLAKPTQPAELFVARVPHLKSFERITHGFAGNIPNRFFANPTLVDVDSGKFKIPTFVFKPRGSNGSKHPVVVAVHGGPNAQERPLYSFGGLYQYLLGKGIGIIAPNIRGSTGYGKTYASKILHNWGGPDVEDVASVVEFASNLRWVDDEKLGIFGASYGGFLTLSAITRMPRIWKVAADLSGPSNLITFAKGAPPHWRMYMNEWVGNWETEKDFLWNRSPMSRLDQIECPLLIIQGANDPRVRKSESDQVVRELRKLGKAVKYKIYRNEGHGFVNRSNEIDAFGLVGNFLANNLLD